MLLILVSGLRSDFGLGLDSNRLLDPSNLGERFPAMASLWQGGQLHTITAGAASHERSAAMVPWMTGRQNAALNLWGDETFDLRDEAFTAEHPGVTTLPELFQAAGWATAGYGEGFSPACFGRQGWDTLQASAKGTRRYQLERSRRLVRETAVPQDGLLRSRRTSQGPLVEIADDPIEERYADVMHTALACTEMRRLAAGPRPWMVGLSLNAPRLPFCVPRRLIDPDQERDANHGLLTGAVAGPTAPDRFADGADDFLPIPGMTIEALRSTYRAAVRLVDEQVARVNATLSEIAALPDVRPTEVHLVSTHGMGLGDDGVMGDRSLIKSVCEVPWISAIRGAAAMATDGSDLASVGLGSASAAMTSRFIAGSVGLSWPDHVPVKSLAEWRDAESAPQTVSSFAGMRGVREGHSRTRADVALGGKVTWHLAKTDRWIVG